MGVEGPTHLAAKGAFDGVPQAPPAAAVPTTTSATTSATSSAVPVVVVAAVPAVAVAAPTAAAAPAASVASRARENSLAAMLREAMAIEEEDEEERGGAGALPSPPHHASPSRSAVRRRLTSRASTSTAAASPTPAAAISAAVASMSAASGLGAFIPAAAHASSVPSSLPAPPRVVNTPRPASTNPPKHQQQPQQQLQPVYLADLVEHHSHVGVGVVGKNGEAGYRKAPSRGDDRVRVAGRAMPHGLTMQPPPTPTSNTTSGVFGAVFGGDDGVASDDGNEDAATTSSLSSETAIDQHVDVGADDDFPLLTTTSASQHLPSLLAAAAAATRATFSSTATVVYALRGGYEMLTGAVALTDSATSDTRNGPESSPVRFELWGSGAPRRRRHKRRGGGETPPLLLWRSSPISASRTPPQHFAVCVLGVQVLRLVVACAAGNEGAYAAWIDPLLSPVRPWACGGWRNGCDALSCGLCGGMRGQPGAVPLPWVAMAAACEGGWGESASGAPETSPLGGGRASSNTTTTVRSSDSSNGVAAAGSGLPACVPSDLSTSGGLLLSIVAYLGMLAHEGLREARVLVEAAAPLGVGAIQAPQPFPLPLPVATSADADVSSAPFVFGNGGNTTTSTGGSRASATIATTATAATQSGGASAPPPPGLEPPPRLLVTSAVHLETPFAVHVDPATLHALASFILSCAHTAVGAPSSSAEGHSSSTTGVRGNGARQPSHLDNRGAAVTGVYNGSSSSSSSGSVRPPPPQPLPIGAPAALVCAAELLRVVTANLRRAIAAGMPLPPLLQPLPPPRSAAAATVATDLPEAACEPPGGSPHLRAAVAANVPTPPFMFSNPLMLHAAAVAAVVSDAAVATASYAPPDSSSSVGGKRPRAADEVVPGSGLMATKTTVAEVIPATEATDASLRRVFSLFSRGDRIMQAIREGIQPPRVEPLPVQQSLLQQIILQQRAAAVARPVSDERLGGFSQSGIVAGGGAMLDRAVVSGRGALAPTPGVDRPPHQPHRRPVHRQQSHHAGKHRQKGLPAYAAGFGNSSSSVSSGIASSGSAAGGGGDGGELPAETYTSIASIMLSAAATAAAAAAAAASTASSVTASSAVGVNDNSGGGSGNSSDSGGEHGSGSSDASPREPSIPSSPALSATSMAPVHKYAADHSTSAATFPAAVAPSTPLINLLCVTTAALCSRLVQPAAWRTLSRNVDRREGRGGVCTSPFPVSMLPSAGELLRLGAALQRAYPPHSSAASPSRFLDSAAELVDLVVSHPPAVSTNASHPPSSPSTGLQAAAAVPPSPPPSGSTGLHAVDPRLNVVLGVWGHVALQGGGGGAVRGVPEESTLRNPQGPSSAAAAGENTATATAAAASTDAVAASSSSSASSTVGVAGVLELECEWPHALGEGGGSGSSAAAGWWDPSTDAHFSHIPVDTLVLALQLHAKREGWRTQLLGEWPSRIALIVEVPACPGVHAFAQQTLPRLVEAAAGGACVWRWPVGCVAALSTPSIISSEPATTSATLTDAASSPPSPYLRGEATEASVSPLLRLPLRVCPAPRWDRARRLAIEPGVGAVRIYCSSIGGSSNSSSWEGHDCVEAGGAIISGRGGDSTSVTTSRKRNGSISLFDAVVVGAAPCFKQRGPER